MGTSGSGKTTAGKKIDRKIFQLFPDDHHYVLDTQHQGDFGIGLVQDRAPGLPKRGNMYQIWQPLRVIPDEIEKWLDMIFNHPPAVLMVDELYVLKYRRDYSEMYTIIQRAGRARGITTISHTQKLAKVPTDAYEQSTHRMGFYIEGVYNKYIRSELLKSERVPNPTHDYGFYYQHINGRGEPFYYRDIQHFLGER